MNETAAPSAAIEAECVVVGAGPSGLFAVFELGLLGMKCHVVDSLGHPGGQCAELYPDKPIYDIPALPVCGAQEPVDRLLEQIRPSGAGFHLGQEVTGLRRRDDGRFELTTARGTASMPARRRRGLPGRGDEGADHQHRLRGPRCAMVSCGTP